MLQKNAAFRAAQLVFLNTWTPQQTYAVWLIDASAAGNAQTLFERVEQSISCAALRAWYGEIPTHGVARASGSSVLP